MGDLRIVGTSSTPFPRCVHLLDRRQGEAPGFNGPSKPAGPLDGLVKLSLVTGVWHWAQIGMCPTTPRREHIILGTKG